MRNRRGFTLIELLVVVAIIALLIALLLPSLARAKDEANNVRCQANLHAISVAFSTYAQQNKDLMPQSRYFYRPDYFVWAGSPRQCTWPEALLIDGDIQATYNPAAIPANPICGTGVFRCPKAGDPGLDGGSLPNRWGYGMAWLATSDFYQNTGTGKWRMLIVQRNLNPNHIVAVDGLAMMGSAAANARTPDRLDPAADVTYGVYLRHRRNSTNGANYLMADSHVEWNTKFGKMPSPYGTSTASFSKTMTDALDAQKVEWTYSGSTPPNDMWIHP